ncbi:unnamed protein product [Amoebophrya sp. A25]|nr:unnamed protein product [Amoebophrya sp. A25]|eukprot:GSA25T00016988001.1
MMFQTGGSRPSSASRGRGRHTRPSTGGTTTQQSPQKGATAALLSQQVVPSNRDLEKTLTKYLKEQGAKVGVEVLTSWLYQRGIVRYRMGDYLSCSRDCDRVAERCGGCVHGRILFLNAKAHRRLRNWRSFGLNLYRACVEAVNMDYYPMFSSVAALCVMTPIFDETESLFTGVLLVLQKSPRALLSLLNSGTGVDFFWHVIVDDSARSPPNSPRWAARFRKRLEDFAQEMNAAVPSGDNTIAALKSDNLLQADAGSPRTPGTGHKSAHFGGSSTSKTHVEVTSLNFSASPQKNPTKNYSSPEVPTPSKGPTSILKSPSRDVVGGGTSGGAVISNMEEGIGVTDILSDEELVAERKAKNKASQFLNALGLKTLVFGMTEMRHEESWMGPFELRPDLFRSFVKFCDPNVNLHLSFTTLSLYAELVQTHPHLVNLDDDVMLSKVFDCFLSEKNELLHACTRFLLEVHNVRPDVLRNTMLDLFVKFLGQKPTTLRAFIMCTMLPLVAHATFDSVSDPKSCIDELSGEEKRNLLKYLKLGIDNCLENPQLWAPVRRNIVGFLLLFLNHSSDPLDDGMLLAQCLDDEKLGGFLLTSCGGGTRNVETGTRNVDESPSKSASVEKEGQESGAPAAAASSSWGKILTTSHGAVLIRRIVALGWLFPQFAEGRLVDKLVTALEGIYAKLAMVRADIKVGEASNVRTLPDGKYSSVVSSPRHSSQTQNQSQGGPQYQQHSSSSTTFLSPMKTPRGRSSWSSCGKNSSTRGRSASRSGQKQFVGQRIGGLDDSRLQALPVGGHSVTSFLGGSPSSPSPTRRTTSQGFFDQKSVFSDGDGEQQKKQRILQSLHMKAEKLEALGSALLRALGLLLLKQPNLRFGVVDDPYCSGESEADAQAREGKEQRLQAEIQSQFLGRVGTFPTHHEQWLLSLRPAVRVCGRSALSNISATDLQRVCRGHRLAELFESFGGKAGSFSKNDGIASPINRMQQKPMDFETTMAFAGGPHREGTHQSMPTPSAKEQGTSRTSRSSVSPNKRVHGAGIVHGGAATHAALLCGGPGGFDGATIERQLRPRPARRNSAGSANLSSASPSKGGGIRRRSGEHQAGTLAMMSQYSEGPGSSGTKSFYGGGTTLGTSTLKNHYPRDRSFSASPTKRGTR